MGRNRDKSLGGNYCCGNGKEQGENETLRVKWHHHDKFKSLFVCSKVLKKVDFREYSDFLSCFLYLLCQFGKISLKCSMKPFFV